jgi:hypothetical protein
MSKNNAVIDRLTGDFRYFLTAVWKELNLPQPTRAQLAIAKYLQHGPKRLQISAFRGVGKSWITAAFVLWTLFKDPDQKIMVISASKERADNFSIFCQKLILDIPWLSHLQPRSDDQRWSRISFDVGPAKAHQAPSVKSVGITGQMTGSRANLLIFDDVEVPGNSATDMQREKLLQLVTEAEAILIPEGHSRIMFLGTPQSVFSIYRKLAERSYKPFVWPARYPRKVSGYEGFLAPELEKDIDEYGHKELEWSPTDTRFSDFDLVEREAAMGRSNFMLQFMLDTSLSDAEKFPLKFQDLIVTSVNPDQGPENIVWCSDPRNVLKELPAVGLPGDRFYSPMAIQGDYRPYSETICAVDPSGRGTDETVAVFLSQLNGLIYVREMRAYKEGYSDNTLRNILSGCRSHKATKVLVESNFGDGMVSELMKKHAIEMKVAVDFDEVRATTRKEERIIDTLEPLLNQHRLVIDPKVIEWDYRSNPDDAPELRLQYMLAYQMSRVCREKGAIKHDDRLDALALGCKYFLDAVALSAQQEIVERRRQDWKDMISAFLEHPQQATDLMVLGATPKQMREGSKPRIHTWI